MLSVNAARSFRDAAFRNTAGVNDVEETADTALTKDTVNPVVIQKFDKTMNTVTFD